MMARSSRSRSAGPQGAQPIPVEQENIVDIDVAAEMESSFLEYAYSVIYSRALPDARDGLKPVQRRILYMMNQMGLRPDRGHVKSARVVGEVMGKLHPHGDGAIYDAMVRMAQSFSLRLPVVDGHGNFGSLDDGPAAPRYTEARMSPAALAMTADLAEDTVDFVPNYDNQLLQPAVLPSAYPNLLVNGASGIAVGMATNMAPHNLREVVAAARHLLAHPDADLDALMRHVPGPDLPSGGRIVGLEGIRDAYASGRGSFRMRASIEVEKLTARKTGLVVTELPYGVGPEKVIERLKDAVKNKKLAGIADVVDLTDRKHGLKLVIELKSGFNPQAVLAALYKHTPLEESFGINNVALVDGQPHTMGLKQMLEVYVAHRLEVVRRRTAFRLQKKQDRLHLVEGLLLAMVDIDEVIEIIRSSEDSPQARERLMQVFDLTQVQADHILELRLRQLTKFSRIELEAERDELARLIAELEQILASEQRLREVVGEELQAVADEHGDQRRTRLLENESLGAPAAASAPARHAPGSPDEALMVADTPCWVLLSTGHKILRTADRTPVTPGDRRRKNDALLSAVATTARGEIGALTSSGALHRVQVVDLPTVSEPSAQPDMSSAQDAKTLVPLDRGESLVALVPLDQIIALGTARGVVKRVRPDWPLNREAMEAITVKEGDRVIGAAPAVQDEDQLVFITGAGRLLRFAASLARPQGPSASGVAGMRVADDDAVIGFGVAPAGSDVAETDVAGIARPALVVTVTDGDPDLLGGAPGSVKVTPLGEFPVKGRGTAGVRAHRLLKGETGLALAWAGAAPALASSKAGVARSLPHEFGRRDGSGVSVDAKIEVIGAGETPEPVALSPQHEDGVEVSAK